jgi:hypothetical protein
MLHVYRQVVGLKEVTPIVLTFKRENSGRFPFEAVRLLHRSHLRWLRRIWSVQIRKVPPRAYPGEVRSIRTLLAEEHCKLLHIYFGNNGLFWLPLLNRSPVPTHPVRSSWRGPNRSLLRFWTLDVPRLSFGFNALGYLWIRFVICLVGNLQMERGDSFRPAA